MNILITGATGLIGNQLGKALIRQGHQITILSRNIESAKSNLSFPAIILPWKSYEEEVEPSYFNDIEVVVHLAGESIGGSRWNKERKKQIYDSRIIGTRNIVKSILKSNKSVKKFICASAVGIYGNSFQKVNEESTLGEDFLATVCKDWEKETQKLMRNGINVVIPRIGIVLSNTSGALTEMLPVFSNGIGAVIGDGSQWMSWIHIDDLIGIFCHFIKNKNINGVYNAVAPNPITNKSFSNILANVLGEKLFLPVPKTIIKIMLGQMSTLVIDGQNVSCEKVVNEGFTFKYPDLESALLNLCSELKNYKKLYFNEIWVPEKIENVFSFFADEKNLEKITPNYLNFKVLAKTSDSIQKGTTIDYRLQLHGLSLHWKTLIESFEKNNNFTDIQIQGPYSFWKHFHEFEEFSGGTIIRDKVLYKLPLGKLGSIITGRFVNYDIKKIFDYRKKIISRLFNPTL